MTRRTNQTTAGRTNGGGILFKPDKPGTTGETLSILTNSLSGLDHKLHIVLNKADQFQKIHDFARAYGSLCWNLSKVIIRKDLPRIHTMCLPVPAATGRRSKLLGADELFQPRSSEAAEISFRNGNHINGRGMHGRAPANVPASGRLSDGDGGMGGGLVDLRHTRDEVVAEVHKAPKRRVDNMITRLADSVHLLQMHATVVEAVRKDYSHQLWQGRVLTGGLATITVSAVASSVSLLLPVQASAFAALAGVLSTCGAHWFCTKRIENSELRIVSVDGLNKTYEATYASQIAEGDASFASVWLRIRDRLHVNLMMMDLGSIEKVSESELTALREIVENKVPELRRLAAPLDYSEMIRRGYGFDKQGGRA